VRQITVPMVKNAFKQGLRLVKNPAGAEVVELRKESLA